MGGVLAKICPCLFAEGVGLIGRPIRIPKETYAVPGTAVEIVAHCKYDVTEEEVEWSRVTLVKGKEKEETIFGKDVKKKIGTVRVKDKRKIGLKLDEVWPPLLGLYRVRVTHPETKTTTAATTDLKYDYNHFPDFQKLDIEAEGLITKEMMIQAMCATDTYLSEKEIRKFIKNSDCMKADMVNFNEYVRYMKFARRNSIRPPGRELQLEEEPKEEGEPAGDGGKGKKKEKKKGKTAEGGEE